MLIYVRFVLRLESERSLYMEFHRIISIRRVPFTVATLSTATQIIFRLLSKTTNHIDEKNVQRTRRNKSYSTTRSYRRKAQKVTKGYTKYSFQLSRD